MLTPTTKTKKGSLIPKIIKGPAYVSWVITVIIVLVSTIYYFISQPELPLFYSLATKGDQLAQKEFIFLFPIISFSMNLVHSLAIKVLINYSSLMLRLFVMTTAILQFIFLVSLLRIVIITF